MTVSGRTAAKGKRKHLINASATSPSKPTKKTLVSITPTKVSSTFQTLVLNINNTSKHTAYLSGHASWSTPASSQAETLESENDGRTVFLTNLPSDTTSSALQSAVSSALNLPSNTIEVRFRTPRSAAAERITVATRAEALVDLPPLFSEPSTSTASLPQSTQSAHVRLPFPPARIGLLSITHLPIVIPATNFRETYRKQRRLSRPGKEAIRAHADAFADAFDAKTLPPLISVLEAASGPTADEEDPEEEPWTFVTRGGHHGKSATMPTQPSVKDLSDPYSQRAMALRDGGAGAKVMKKGFAERYKATEKEKEVKGVEGFYKFEKRNKRKEQANELRRKFEEDKGRVERLKQGRRFRPY